MPNSLYLGFAYSDSFSPFSKDVIQTFLPYADEAKIEMVQAVSCIFAKPAGQAVASICLSPSFWVQGRAGLRPRSYVSLETSQHTRAARVLAAIQDDEQFHEHCETEIEARCLTLGDRAEFDGICLRGAVIIKPSRLTFLPKGAAQIDIEEDLSKKIGVYICPTATSHQRMKILAATGHFLTELIQTVVTREIIGEHPDSFDHYKGRMIALVPSTGHDGTSG